MACAAVLAFASKPMAVAFCLALVVVAGAGSEAFAQSGWDGTSVPDIVNAGTLLAALVAKLSGFYPMLILFSVGIAILGMLWRFMTGGRASAVAR